MKAPLPALRWSSAAWVALAATVVLWLPLTVLPILDGLLFVAPPLSVARDIGLLLWLGVVPALSLASLAWALHTLLQRRNAPLAASLAWSLLLLPLGLLVLRQSGRVLLQWVRNLAPEHWSAPTPTLKLSLLVLASVSTLWLMRRLGWARALGALISVLDGLRVPAAALLLASALLLALHPPHWKPMASAPSSAATAPASAPNVLLIALDTVAAADADVCNPASPTMPRLAKFARQATCFSHFQTGSNFTTASVSTIETGLLPWVHQANQPDAPMHGAARQHTIAHQLRAEGWRTHSITDNLLASPRHRGSYAGYDTAWLAPTTLWVNGPRHAATRFPDTALPRLVAASLAFLAPLDVARHATRSPYRSDEVYAELFRLLNQERSNGRPQFVFALTLPPHAPYLPPASTRYKLLPPGQLERLDQLLPDNLAYAPEQQALVDRHRLRYQESLMAADAALGEALDRLDSEGWLKNTVVVITTDHGESFEKGYLGHAGAPLHQALVHGPLVVRLPGQNAGRVVEELVSQADLAPTLLDLAGAKALPRAEGRSLRALLEGRDLAPAPVYSTAMEHQRRNAPLTQGGVVVVDGPWKLHLRLKEDAVQLFHLGQDPGELHDVSTSHPVEVQRLRGLLQDRLQRAEAWHRAP